MLWTNSFLLSQPGPIIASSTSIAPPATVQEGVPYPNQCFGRKSRMGKQISGLSAWIWGFTNLRKA